MSADLEKRVAGDWFDLREAAGDPLAAAKAAGMDGAELRRTSSRLRDSVEGGILEYKRSLLRSVLNPLKSLVYDSRALSGIKELAGMAGAAAWCCLQQRRIALGKVKPEAPHGDNSEEAGEPQQSAKEHINPTSLFEDVRSLFTEHPEFKDEPAGKMIMLQIKQYRQEMAKLKELLEKIPAEKRKPLRENFAYRLREILRKVQQGYDSLIDTLERKSSPEESEGPILLRVDENRLAQMAKRFMQEAELYSRIRSVLLFAADEKFRSRQSLLSLEQVGGDLESVFILEAGDYRTLAPFGDGEMRISFEMAQLVRRIAAGTADDLDYRL
jgi:hypothetical protein